MALDGITIRALAYELNEKLTGAKMRKISQPEKEEIILTFKGAYDQYRLLISANASLPLCYFTNENKTAPPTAPNFCMLLRKHIGSAKVINVSQIGLERVLCICLEHLDDLGDVTRKRLYIELMGKHSNIIFCDDNDNIIDSIKHIGASVSSVREVLPGRKYFIPKQEGRMDAFTISKEDFFESVLSKPTTIVKAISSSFIGFSHIIGVEIANRGGIDSDFSMYALSNSDKESIYIEFNKLIKSISSNEFCPCIVYDKKNPLEFAAIYLSCYEDLDIINMDSISAVLEKFYKEKNKNTNIKQKSTDLRKIVATHIDRTRRKLLLQEKQLDDTQKKDKYKLYGQMLHTFGYEAKPGDKSIEVINYNDGTPLTIPLDPTISAMDNAKKYFDKYDKYKRTYDALISQIEETKKQLEHLLSIESALLIAEDEIDLSAIKTELSEFGYIKKRGISKQKEKKSKPLHFVTDDDFHLYVGKNNYQNEEVTFKIATGNDWWFHAKQMPGSHVILKTEGREVPDNVFEIAASLAAYYSSGSKSDKVEIDYVEKKQVKKTPSGAPGFVIYHTNYSMVASPDISKVHRLS